MILSYSLELLDKFNSIPLVNKYLLGANKVLGVFSRDM